MFTPAALSSATASSPVQPAVMDAMSAAAAPPAPLPT
jgi:hypothetical protein